MRLLVTRPESDGQRTRATLRARGHDVVHAPLLRVVPIAAEIGEGPWDAVILTSANACRALSAILAGGPDMCTNHRRFAAALDCPAFVVGQRTAQAARAAGFTQIESADGDAVALRRLILAHYAARQDESRAAHEPPPSPKLLYLAGENRAAELSAVLAPSGILVETVAMYRAEAALTLPDPVRQALAARTIDGVLHFSSRSAETYLRCAGRESADALAPIQFCLSPRVAAILARAGAERVQTAARPEEDSLLGLITP